MVGRQTVDSVLAFGQQGAKRLRVVPADISDRMVGAFMTKGFWTLVVAARCDPVPDPYGPHAQQHGRPRDW